MNLKFITLIPEHKESILRKPKMEGKKKKTKQCSLITDLSLVSGKLQPTIKYNEETVNNMMIIY